MIRPIGEFHKTVSEIAQYLGLESDSKQSITGISTNSKSIEPGDLFVALPGKGSHGATYFDEVLAKGALAVLTDNSGETLIRRDMPLLVVRNPRAAVGPLVNWFYDSPTSKFSLIGVTGTNGKTTTTHLVNQILKSAGKNTVLIGTLGIELCGENLKTAFTTPEADVLQNIFANAAERHVTQGVMEVSSIALEMGRVRGTHFNFVAFTNLTQDHLDFHGTLERYGAAKAQLFALEYADRSIINIDDPFGKKLFAESSIPSISVSRLNREATWYFEKINLKQENTEVAIRGEGGILIEGEFSLIGEYNLDNLILAVAIAFHSGVDPLVISATLSKLTGAPGRLEKVDIGQDFLALVDYAHTPDAVARSLQAARALSKRVISVLGCGGDRDAAKRPVMGVELSSGSDLAIFTSDNPRTESAEKILDEMLSQVTLNEKNIRITDRRKAIEFAVANAKSGDCILILGKGHETGQEIMGEVLPFDDRVELAKALAGYRG
jgi:UDP-N-acetylmuramoyl-L-alanyl-D-glutamate--2,6-diaminopimelate ligase